MVIVLGGAPPATTPDDESVRAALQVRLAFGDGVRRAADAVAEQLGVPRRRAYAMAIELRTADASEDPHTESPSGDPHTQSPSGD